MMNYGIIRYRPTPGKAPAQDPAHFDGWYDKSEAKAVYRDWCKRYPKFIVALVVMKDFREL